MFPSFKFRINFLTSSSWKFGAAKTSNRKKGFYGDISKIVVVAKQLKIREISGSWFLDFLG